MVRNFLRIFLFIFLLMGMLEKVLAADNGEHGITNLEVTLIVDGKKITETQINLSKGDSIIEVPASIVLSSLSSLIAPDNLHNLEKQMSPEGTFTNKILDRNGITLTINRLLRQALLSFPKLLSIQGPKTKTETQRQDHLGPWTTPAFPALKGQGGDSLQDKADTLAVKQTLTPPKLAADSNTLPLVKDVPPIVKLETYTLDQTEDELYEEAFNHKPEALPQNVQVNLFVDGKSLGMLWTLYSKEQKQYTFPVDLILVALKGLVKYELWDKLAKRQKLKSQFTIKDLNECGFPSTLNTEAFELRMTVPAQALGTQVHYMSGEAIDPYKVPVLAPNELSAYMNMRIKERLPYYQYSPSPFDSSGYGKVEVEELNKTSREPLNSNFDGAINVKSWVLEGNALLLERPSLNSFDFSRQDIRLVHDWPHEELRLSVGDLIFPTSGFQSFQNIGGIGLSRDFSLQPHLPAYPVKELEFYLTNPSEVRVYINGTLRGTYIMGPGAHDLGGFPFTEGESEVEVRITDNTGQQQNLNFSFIHESSLLAKGLSAFSYNIGFPRKDIYQSITQPIEKNKFKVLNYVYDLGHPFLFLDYRRGISDVLTAEVYSQSLDTASMIGADALRALKLGKIKLELAGSYNKAKGTDWAGNLEYTFIPKPAANVSPMSWRFKMEYLGNKFFRPNQDPRLLGSLTLAAAFQKHSKFFDLSFSPTYSIRSDTTNFYSLLFGVNKNWMRGLASSLTLRNNLDRQGFSNTSIAATISYNFDYEINTFSASERMENHIPTASDKGAQRDWDYTTDLNWSYNSSAPFPANPLLRASTSFGPQSNQYLGDMVWRSNQGNLQVMGQRFEPKTASVINNYLDLGIQSSLVYVDGNFALARPVSNSFVFVKGTQNESHCDVLVNASEMGYDAKASSWFPGVISNMDPYYLRKIHLDVQDPPFGSNEDKTDYTLYPSYKSGYALYVGTSASIIALGTLQIAPGVPAEYQTFLATPLDGEKRDPVQAFTNGVGKFQLTRMQPGDYKIDLEVDGKALSVLMVLPKNANGIKSVGTLILKPK